MGCICEHILYGNSVSLNLVGMSVLCNALQHTHYMTYTVHVRK